MEGSIAVATTAARCGIEVVAAYPITPSTHIPEELSKVQKEHGYEFVPVEAEFSAISALIGASAAGARTFTATSSQGLLLMHEALHNASGLRLPIVMAVAMRSIGAPLNIWTDWQDAMYQRDTGWIQLHCKNNQEAVDTLIQAFRIAEKSKFPIMVCFEGHYLTHEISAIDLPEKKEIAKFLPKYKPEDSLETGNPMTFGEFMPPKYYQEYKEEQHREMLESMDVISEVAKEFEKKFGRKQFPIVEKYMCDDAEIIYISMNALAENIENVVDSLRKKGEKAGLLRIKCFRPFPKEAISHAIEGKKHVIIMEKDISMGIEGVLSSEIKVALFECKDCTVSKSGKMGILNVICGLGGKDVTLQQIESLYERAKKGEEGFAWL